MPGGIDSHVHLSQPAFDGPKMADGFASGTRSAIAGGNTTVLPFASWPTCASHLGHLHHTQQLNEIGRVDVPSLVVSKTSLPASPMVKVLPGY